MDIAKKTQVVQQAAKAYNNAMVQLQGVTGSALTQVEEDLKILNDYKSALNEVSKGMNLIVPVPVIPNFK